MKNIYMLSKENKDGGCCLRMGSLFTIILYFIIYVKRDLENYKYIIKKL